jgi:hypothetical protein
MPIQRGRHPGCGLKQVWLKGEGTFAAHHFYDDRKWRRAETADHSTGGGAKE